MDMDMRHITFVSVISNSRESKNRYRHGDCLSDGKYIVMKTKHYFMNFKSPFVYKEIRRKVILGKDPFNLCFSKFSGFQP